MVSNCLFIKDSILDFLVSRYGVCIDEVLDNLKNDSYKDDSGQVHNLLYYNLECYLRHPAGEYRILLAIDLAFLLDSDLGIMEVKHIGFSLYICLSSGWRSLLLRRSHHFDNEKFFSQDGFGEFDKFFSILGDFATCAKNLFLPNSFVILNNIYLVSHLHEFNITKRNDLRGCLFPMKVVGAIRSVIVAEIEKYLLKFFDSVRLLEIRENSGIYDDLLFPITLHYLVSDGINLYITLKNKSIDRTLLVCNLAIEKIDGKSYNNYYFNYSKYISSNRIDRGVGDLASELRYIFDNCFIFS